MRVVLLKDSEESRGRGPFRRQRRVKKLSNRQDSEGGLARRPQAVVRTHVLVDSGGYFWEFEKVASYEVGEERVALCCVSPSSWLGIEESSEEIQHG